MKCKPRTTVHKRFECIDPERNHRKFYELSVEMLLFGPTVTRRWGRIGSRRPRTLFKDYQTWEEAKREVNAILRKRERRGYRVLES
jgi:predicted DNA-binding WGR domain protein